MGIVDDLVQQQTFHSKEFSSPTSPCRVSLVPINLLLWPCTAYKVISRCRPPILGIQITFVHPMRSLSCFFDTVHWRINKNLAWSLRLSLWMWWPLPPLLNSSLANSNLKGSTPSLSASSSCTGVVSTLDNWGSNRLLPSLVFLCPCHHKHLCCRPCSLQHIYHH